MAMTKDTIKVESDLIPAEQSNPASSDGVPIVPGMAPITAEGTTEGEPKEQSKKGGG